MTGAKIIYLLKNLTAEEDARVNKVTFNEDYINILVLWFLHSIIIAAFNGKPQY